MVATRARVILAFVTLMLTVSPSRGDDSLDALWAAARAGDLPTIKKLVTEGADVNAGTEYGATALSFASTVTASNPCSPAALTAVEAVADVLTGRVIPSSNT